MGVRGLSPSPKSIGSLMWAAMSPALARSRCAANPVEEAGRIKAPKTGGYHTWSEAEIGQYQARHPLGTRARLALEIMLWTWQRRGDARLFGPSDLKDGKFNYRQGKTGKELWLPAAPQLLDAIAAMQRVGLRTYLVTEFGKPFSAAGCGNKMREWCDEAGLSHCTSHGLRKAGARRAAQLGAGNQGLKAVGGWSGESEVAIYTAAVEQEALAAVTLGRVIEDDLANHGSEIAKFRTEVPNNEA
jgi:integrase